MDHIHVDPETVSQFLPKHSSDVLGVQLPGDVWKLIPKYGQNGYIRTICVVSIVHLVHVLIVWDSKIVLGLYLSKYIRQ